MHSGHQLGELLIAQSCHSLIPQRLLHVDFAVWLTTKQNDWSRCPSSMTRAIHRLCRNCELALRSGKCQAHSYPLFSGGCELASRPQTSQQEKIQHQTMPADGGMS